MAAGGRNPQKSAVARARKEARMAQEGAGGGGKEGAAGRAFSQDAADAAAAKRNKTKADREAREKKAEEQAAKEKRQADKRAKEEMNNNPMLNVTEADDKPKESGAAGEEEDIVARFADLEVGCNYGATWTLAEAMDDKVTKKNLADFLLSAAPDDLKEEHGMSKGAIKKKPKDFWLECYAVYLRTQSGAGGEQ
eukprot:TRINITY_DN21136_c0_g1_i2.p1 TRINITY_DN21136_c0_g1~~TRINITY_DN21136_c0_g1_i2.p1  ORF type:complete len:194 (+),score=73.62 TRINITY_DN21136_c0_g1_i2:200-781(+)